MKDLSRRQQAILDFIENFLDENDYPPTIRDIQAELGISSTSVVDYNLKVLEAHNLIRRNRNISRGIELVNRAGAAQSGGCPDRRTDCRWTSDSCPRRAGRGRVQRSRSSSVLSSSRMAAPISFALRVKGHSMVDLLINDGDVVLLKHQATCENGDTVAVWLRDEKETTLKKFYYENGRVRLQPANVTMEPIYTNLENVEIQGNW
ncbi:MAG: S24 family peptidase [Thermomicrobiales bacterium]